MEPVTFLMFDAHGRGGLARSVIGVANALAEHRPVRVISLWRRAEDLHFPLDPRVDFEVLLDRQAGLSEKQQRRTAKPTKVRPLPVEKAHGMNRATDKALAKRLAGFKGVLVSTRPSLHLAAISCVPPRARVIGWDHKNFVTRWANPRMKDVLRSAVPALAEYVVLTEADATDYRRDLGRLAPPIRVIPNALSWPTASEPAALDSRVVTAAGRLEQIKGFDRLLEAYAPLADEFPQWTLRIHGTGSRADALQRSIAERGLAPEVELAGYADDFRGVLRESAIFAMTSRAEGFPMVLLEALAEGVPPVSMDCPRGPAEIIVDGKNGLLTPDGDLPAFTEALRTLMRDDELRRECGRRAHADSERYQLPAIAAEWHDLIDRVAAR